jgi:hypothetical protein
MAYLGRGLDKISNIEVLDNITFDGSSSYSITKNSVAFTPNSAQSLLISIDGVVQATNFTVSSSTIDFGVAIPSTSVCNFFLHYGTGVAFTPSDGSVTTAKLGDDAVTGAKLSYPLTTFSSTGIDDNASATAMTINSSGSITKPNQPAFSAYASANQNNRPLGYTNIANNTEVFDTQGNYNTATYTFTAPVDGKYYFSASVSVINVPSNAGWIMALISTSNGSKNFSRPIVWYDTASGDKQFSMPINGVFDLDENDTAYARFYQFTGSAGVTDIVANQSYAWFEGYLLG